MYWKSQGVVFNRLQATNILGALAQGIIFPGLAAGCQFILRTDGLRLQSNTLFASLVQPTFGGYAGVVTTGFNVVNLGTNDLGIIYAPSIRFVAVGTPTPPGVVTGWALLDVAGTDWILGEDFPNPGFNFAAVADFLEMDVFYPQPLSYRPNVV